MNGTIDWWSHDNHRSEVMSDEFRRLWEQQRSLHHLIDPTVDLWSHIRALDDPLWKRAMASATTDYLRQEEEAHHKMVSDLAVAGGTAEMLRRLDFTTKYLCDLEDARRLSVIEEHSVFSQSVRAAIEAQQSYENLFRLPGASELNRLAHEALVSASLPRAVLGSEENLAAAMARMHSPWSQIEEPIRSAKAFSEIVAIGRGIAGMQPFDFVLSDALRLGLGDWRDWSSSDPEQLINPVIRTEFYIERGFDPRLTDFTPSAFDEGLRIAGLREVDETESPDEDENGFTRAREAFVLLQRFEIALRRFIVKAMESAYGEKWMQYQLPATMLDSWIDKKEKAVKAGQEERPLIEYADFSDYKGIIERKDNWNSVFKQVFGRQEDIRESLQRLFPVRIATMHARLVTKDDQLLLLVETKRVLKTIRSR